MAAVEEMNSFISKYYQLWNNGYEADLHLRCIMGQSFVTLQTALGYCDNSARARRRAKCADARKTLNKESESEANLSTEQVQEESEGVEITDDNILDETKSVTNLNIEKVQEDVDVDTGNEIVDNEKSVLSNADAEKDLTHEQGDSSCVDDEAQDKVVEQFTSEQVDLVEVFATAIFENSPHESLKQEELDSLLRCVNSMEHLKRNIATISMDGHSTESFGITNFKHVVQLRIYVKAANYGKTLEATFGNTWEEIDGIGTTEL